MPLSSSLACEENHIHRIVVTRKGRPYQSPAAHACALSPMAHASPGPCANANISVEVIALLPIARVDGARRLDQRFYCSRTLIFINQH
jgi:hypothetical protein